MSGLILTISSYEKPQRSSTPLEKFSVTASLTEISSSRMGFASACRISRVTPSFSTLWLLNVPPRLMPRRSSIHGPLPRKMSHCPCRSLSSTRMTCAPNAARMRVAPAPASWPVKSQMRMLERAGQGGLCAVIRVLPSQSSQESADFVEGGMVEIPVAPAGGNAY